MPDTAVSICVQKINTLFLESNLAILVLQFGVVSIVIDALFLQDSRLRNYLQMVITYVVSMLKINYDNFDTLYFGGATPHYARIVQDYVDDILRQEDEVQ